MSDQVTSVPHQGIFDRSTRGIVLPSVSVGIERGGVQFFCQVMGIVDPVHHNVDAARAAGYPDIVALPSFADRLFEVGGGWVSETRWEQSEGVFFQDAFSAEELADNWSEVTSFEKSRHARSVSAARTGIRERAGSDLALARQ